MKPYEERSMNFPKVRLEKTQIEYIQEQANKKGIKQSKIIRLILRRYYEATLSELVNPNDGNNRD